MRITTPPALGPVQTSQPGARATGPRAAFELAAGSKPEAAATAGPRAAASAAGLETLIAVQGMVPDERRERRRRAVKRGREELDLLDELKLAMLSGAPVPAVLLKLRGLTALKGEATGEAGLDDVLAEIDLRAQVEIAKREAAAR